MRQDALKILDALARGDLAGARTLRIPGLRELPAEVFGLAETLEILDIGDGELTTLPADFGRLRKLKILFCSGNGFDVLPPSLGDCGALSQIGFRGCGLREIPDEALPPRLRWLTLTDNRIARLPTRLGDLPLLQKAMFSGNRLTSLPPSLAGASRLELIRLGSNHFESLPGWLPELPALAWGAWNGNPFDVSFVAAPNPSRAERIPWREIEMGDPLGEGASGRVHRALWRNAAGARALPVAVKLFRGAMTSDGLPDSEITACLAAGEHPNLIGAHGRIDDHPTGEAALLTPLIPEGWRALAGPPDAESCSRDVYAPGLRLTMANALQLALGIADAVAHLHARDLSHGDLYAHNILWDSDSGASTLTDFGAASPLPAGTQGDAWRRVETRAFGLLLEELLDVCAEQDITASLWALARACTQPTVAARPTMAEVHTALASFAISERPEP
jgi:hypothetical protein